MATTATIKRDGGKKGALTDIDLMTERERRIAKRNADIVEEFGRLDPEMRAKGYKPYRTVRVLAEKHAMSPAGVRFVLARAGAITALRALR